MASDTKGGRFDWLKPPKLDESGSMSLWDHLREIRYRLIVSVLAILVFFVIAFFFYEALVEIILYPYTVAAEAVKQRNPEADIQVVNAGVAAPMILALKASGLAAIIAACPVWIYQLWAFIVPGLLTKEKRVAQLFLLSAIPLFLLGVTVGYIVLPRAFEFLLGFTVSNAGVANLQDLNDFLSLEMRMLLVFGLSFLLPVVIVMLNMLGVLKAYMLAKARSVAVFGCFLFAAVATPSGDPFSMLALSMPMAIMYVVSELICRRRDNAKINKMLKDGIINEQEAEEMRSGARA